MRKYLHLSQANPKLADRKDDDERLPIHWATSYGHLEIAKMLAAQKNFDPDVQVRSCSL
jgi:26S proteasome non-ATPase regulatory subunit 10